MALHADEHGDETNPRLVLVHGFTQTGASWSPLLPRLTPHHRVVAVDAPAHGRSAHHTTDLAAGATLLADTGGRAAYLGYSMGGRLLLHLAVQRPDLVERVVLVGATAGIDADEERAQRRQADEALARDLETHGLHAFLERWLANPLFATLAPDAAAVDDRRRNTVAGLAASLRLMGTGTQRPLWADLAHVDAPALFVAGERDEKFTALAHRLADAWGGPAAVTVIAGAGHACHLERPDAFLDAVEPFLGDGDGDDHVDRRTHRTDSPTARSSP